MAKKAKEEIVAVTAEGAAASIISSLNKNAKGSLCYQIADHYKYTYGVRVPHLIFQWMIGGSNILPMQRVYSESGAPKSFKSTLAVEIGSWFVLDNGIFFDLDNESKTSATMLEAMTWWRMTPEQTARIIYQETRSVEEWMQKILGIIAYVRTLPPAPKGQRIPVYISLDSLTGKASEDTQEEMIKEGEAKARQFPVTIMQITNFIKALDLTDITLSFGFVRHAKPSMDPNDHQKLKEAGGFQASFASSISIMMKKVAEFEGASHPALPHADIAYSGKTIRMWSEMSCLGPDKRTIEVDILWQYVDHEFTETDEAGNEVKRQGQKQIMLYDWAGALGEHLWMLKYGKDTERCCDTDKERLGKFLEFTATGKKIKCEELGLDGASFTAFGKAIEGNPEVRKRVAGFLNITNYQNVQNADISIAVPKSKDKDN